MISNTMTGSNARVKYVCVCGMGKVIMFSRC